MRSFRRALVFTAFIWLMHQVAACAQSPESELVSRFLTISTLKQLDKPARKAMILPEFLAGFGEKAAKADVNMYVPDGFAIEKDSSGMVSAFVWGPGRSWAHRLVFQVVQHQNKYYIRPPDSNVLSDFNMFNPWIRVDKHISKQLLPLAQMP